MPPNCFHQEGKWFERITNSIGKGKSVNDFFPTKSIDPYKIGGIVLRSLFWCKFFWQMYLCFLWIHLLKSNSMESCFFQIDHCILFWIVLLDLWMHAGVFLYLVTNEIMNLFFNVGNNNNFVNINGPSYIWTGW